jgi:hypothetical protein
MNHTAASPFDSIESAHDFVSLFVASVADAKREIESDIQREVNAPASRRLDALRLAAYNLEKLEQHVKKSRVILNDLRSLRRLLFEERAAAAGSSASAKPAPKVATAAPVVKPFLPPPLPPSLPAASIPQTGRAPSKAAVMA